MTKYEKYTKARKSIAKKINISVRKLIYILYIKGVENCYEYFEIPKKSGGVRKIYAPNAKLKSIQRKIATTLNDINGSTKKDQFKITVSHGFEKNKNIYTNAIFHRNKRYILNVDISNFFESFHFGRVRGYLKNNRNFALSDEEATIIAQLVCYNQKLPQGAPTSPIISNLIFNIVDLQILKLVKKYKLKYTRYADDLTFSTNDKNFKDISFAFLDNLIKLLRENGFELNNKKTRLEFFSNHQEVTGLTVNKKVNPTMKMIKDTRAMADNLYKNGCFYINGAQGTINQLEGRFSFINQIDWNNNKLEYKNSKKVGWKNYISKFNKRERQYQIFLFYKYFFNPDKPIIVTEGKTDIAYIKAALKKYYKDYNNLIIKKDNKYEFKVNFLKKTSRLKYFFGIVPDGADTFMNILNHYVGKNSCLNIDNILFKKSDSHLKNVKRNPVILLMDNEQNDGKPLCKFLKVLFPGNKTPSMGNNIKKHIKSNLYLQTLPLLEHKTCEIEDLLFPNEISNIKIDGKTFSKISNKYAQDTFGKYRLSQYITEHFEDFDFKNFKTLLDSISDIVNEEL